MSLRNDLEELAKSVRIKAGLPDTPLAESIDALKALTALFVATEKHPGKVEDEESSFESFAAIMNSNEEDKNEPGKTPVRSRRRGNDGVN